MFLFRFLLEAYLKESPGMDCLSSCASSAAEASGSAGGASLPGAVDKFSGTLRDWSWRGTRVTA